MRRTRAFGHRSLFPPKACKCGVGLEKVPVIDIYWHFDKADDHLLRVIEKDCDKYERLFTTVNTITRARRIVTPKINFRRKYLTDLFRTRVCKTRVHET